MIDKLRKYIKKNKLESMFKEIYGRSFEEYISEYGTDDELCICIKNDLISYQKVKRND